MIVMTKDLDETAPPRRRAQLELRTIGEEQLADLARLNARRNDRHADARFRSYVRQGFDGFVAYVGGEVAGYYWWVGRERGREFPDLRDRGLGIELGERDVYGSDFYVLPEHRGGATAAELLYRIEDELRGRGYRWLWGFALSDNLPARWIYSSRGYTSRWAVVRRRFLFLRRTAREAV